MQASVLIRMNVALGLNCSGNYNTFANPLSLATPSIGNPNDPACMERLRNLFWASYLLDRQSVVYMYNARQYLTLIFPPRQHLATGWAPAITDDDVSQELPARCEDFDAGVCDANHHPVFCVDSLLSLLDKPPFTKTNITGS